MTRYRPRPSGLLVPDYEVRGLSGRRVAGRGGRVGRYGGSARVVSVPPAGGGGGSVTLTVCSPTTGVVGDTLTLTGTGFETGQVVLVGGVAGDNIVYTSSTSINVDIPSGVSGLLDVSVAGVMLEGAVTVWAEPDIYEWGFEGATDALAKGDFIAGAGGNYISAAPDPGTGWQRDTSIFHVGAQSVRQDYPTSEANVGSAFFYGLNQGLPSGLKACYVAFWYRHDAAADLGDAWKGVRFSVDVGGGHAGTWSMSSRNFFWDNLNGAATYSANMNTPIPTADSARGAWHHYELYWDISDEVTWDMVFYGWIDGVQYFGDRTWSVRVAGAQSVKTLGAGGQYGIAFDGTVNRLDNDSSAWFDHVAISQQRIGVRE